MSIIIMPMDWHHTCLQECLTAKLTGQTFTMSFIASRSTVTFQPDGTIVHEFTPELIEA
jgi:hypothetical protein